MAMQCTPNLAGEIAIVTGGTRNIGLAIARTLAAHGASVCVTGHGDQVALEAALKLLHADGAQATGLLGNVAEPAMADKVFDRAERELGGPVSILVNGAASRPHTPLLEIQPEEWEAVLGVVLGGAFYMAQRLFSRLPAERRGAIVNLGGLSAHRPAVDRPHVIAAKTGLEGLTRALAEEGLERIRANCIVPGAIETERRPGQSAPHKEEKGPARMTGTSEDVAAAVLPFCDPTQSYVTGQTVHVDGGRYMP